MSDGEPQAEASRPNTEINPTATEKDTNIRSGKEQETEVQLGTETTEIPAGIIEDTEVNLGTEENTEQPETEQEITVHPRIDEDTKIQPGIDEDTKIQSRINEDTKIQPRIDEDTKVQQGTDENTKVQPGIDEDTKLQAGIHEDIKVQPGIDEDTKVQPGTDKDTKVQPGIDKDTKVQPGIDEDTKVQSGTDEDTKVQQGTDKDTKVQPGIDEDTKVQPGIDKDTKVQPGTDKDTKVQPGTDEDTKVQPGTDEDTKVQPGTDEDTKIQPGIDNDNHIQAGIEEEEETKVPSEIASKDPKVQAGKDRDPGLQPSITQDANPQPDTEADREGQQGTQPSQGQDTRQHSPADPNTTDDSSSGTKAADPSSSHTDVHTEPEEEESGRQAAAEVDSDMMTGKPLMVQNGAERNGAGEKGEQEKKRQDTNRYHDDGPRCGTRHVLVLWAFLGFANLFIQRVAMSIALVAMASQNVSHPAATTNNNLNSSAEPCGEESSSGQLRDSHVKAEFQWGNTLQGFILSAFYYGYFSTQIPSSFLTGRIGGKRMFAFGVGGCSVLAALTPLCARLHPGALVANRVLQGCIQGVVFPAMQTLLSVWVPAKERSRLVATTYAGCQAGTVIGTLGAGYLCDSSLGWPVVFYIEGALGFLWCLGWMAFTFDSPASHPRISDEERLYLRRTVDNHHRKTPRIPCRSIMTSPALYAIAAAHFGNDWGCFAVMTCLPKFMKDILNYDLSANGFLSSLPYLVMWATNLVAGALADFLRKPNRMKTAHVRKLMVFIGLVGPACLLVASAYYPGCSRTPMVVLLTLAMGLSGFTIAGHSVNHLDIAPVFAGLLFAMTNSFGTTTGWIGPALAGALTEHNDTRERWQIFFLVSGAVYAVGGSIYLLLARGDIQPWAQVDDSETEYIIPARNYMSTQAQDNPALENGEK